MIDWLANFALIEVFPVWQNAISLAGVLVCFGGLAAMAIVFIWTGSCPRPRAWRSRKSCGYSSSR